MITSTRKVTMKFAEGDKVLCYEPDPTKAKVLYDSKVLDVHVSRDASGRRIAEYLIHFSGWSSSWDRIVKEEYILPDTEENRALQEKLVKEAATSLKGKRKNLPPAIRGNFAKQDKDKQSDSEKNDTNDEEEDESSSESEPDIEPFPEPVVKHDVIITIPASLKMILHEDCKFIKEKNKVINIPLKQCAMFILELYVKHAAQCLLRVPLPPTHKEAEKAFQVVEKKIEFVKEVMRELMVLMNYLLPRILLYNEEKKQYYHTGSQVIFERHVWKECDSEHYKSCIECKSVHIRNCFKCSYCHTNNCSECLQSKIKKCMECQDRHIENCLKCSETHLLICKTCLKRHLSKCHSCIVKHCNNCTNCFNAHIEVCSICAPENKNVSEENVSSSESEKPPSPQISRRSLRSDNKRLSTDSDNTDVVPRKLRKSTMDQSQQIRELNIQALSSKDLKNQMNQNKELENENSKNKEVVDQEQNNKESISKTKKNRASSSQRQKNKESTNQSLKNKEMTNQSLKNKEMTNAKQKDKELPEETSSCRELRSRTPKNKEFPNKGEKSKEQKNKELVNEQKSKNLVKKELANKEQKNRDSANKNQKNKDLPNKEQKNRDSTNKDLLNKEQKSKGLPNKESSNKEQKSKESIPKELKRKDSIKSKGNVAEFSLRRNLRSSGKFRTEDETMKQENSQELETSVNPVAEKVVADNDTSVKKEPSINIVAPTRMSTRSTRSSVCSDTLTSLQISNIHQDSVAAISTSPPTNRKKRSSPASSPLPQLPVKTEKLYLHSHKPSFYQEIIESYELVTEAEFFNNRKAPPSFIYGAHHLLRLFVKLPDTLNKLSVSEEKIANIVDVIHDFLEFMEVRKEEFFRESYYVDYSD